MDTELWKSTATELAAEVTRGEVTAAEVVESHLARIAEVNPAVNAVTQLMADDARMAARETDRRRAAGERLGPLAGVPFTVKENIHVAGWPTTHGVEKLRDHVPEADSPPVRRLRDAGAIPIGHANMPDLALSSDPASQLYGKTYNPWAPEKTPGGTSSGDGVAVAVGMAALGLGNDSGGSVRLPASFNGVAGLKPSYGRFAADHRVRGQEPTLASQLIPVDGPLARTVADLRAAFETLAGTDPEDPRAVPAPLAGPQLATPVKVGVVIDPVGAGVHPEIRAGIDEAATALEAAGYVLEEVEIPRLAETLEGYGKLIMTEFGLNWHRTRQLLSEEGRRHIDLFLERVPHTELAEYVRQTAVRLGIQRDWSRLQADYPLLLAATSTQPVPVAVRFDDTESHAQAMLPLALCTATSFVGVPAVSVPCGFADGMPRGVQLIGQMYREDLCLEAAEVIEDRFGVLAPIDPRRR
ncbi:indole acetimide hydrolase [Streptomyces piniterrae]|uniref:Indole acetimide hydrolase n=1 Tax=Streptomyces piniterrae TaxID=2571125 RepID=A0A4U0NRZ0_9ACTN|nr:amidase [Streptomyces piniterrae]TJZ57285.1 indole acetimide hydrolase [Streptomyces piniterrae]